MNSSVQKSRKAPNNSATERVESYIRNAIYAGRLRPNYRVIEETLAVELNISRGPVREALLRLESEGLIVRTARRGTFVRDISLVEIGVVFRMRGKLEGLCARYMRERAIEEYRPRLEVCLEKMKKAVSKADEERFFHSDMNLHRTIWEASNQPLLYQTLNSVMNPFIFMIARANSSSLAMEERFKDHKQYVSMILTTPLPRVEREVEKYFSRLYDNVFRQSGHYQAASTLWSIPMARPPLLP